MVKTRVVTFYEISQSLHIEIVPHMTLKHALRKRKARNSKENIHKLHNYIYFYEKATNIHFIVFAFI
jgi:hypothetical protein